MCEQIELSISSDLIAPMRPAATPSRATDFPLMADGKPMFSIIKLHDAGEPAVILGSAQHQAGRAPHDLLHPFRVGRRTRTGKRQLYRRPGSITSTWTPREHSSSTTRAAALLV